MELNDVGEEVGVDVQQHPLVEIKLDRVMEKASIVLAAEVFALNSRANKDGQLLLLRLVLWILCSNGRANKKTIIQFQQELEQSQDFRSLKFKNIYKKFRKKLENKYETNQIHIFDFKIGF